jgi:hypothetical protein
MLFAGVLDLVVRNAAETLNEQHDGGNAGPADLRAGCARGFSRRR